MSRPYQQEVVRGIAWLDEHHIGWRELVNVAALRMSSCWTCVLGQLFSDEDETGFALVSLQMEDRGIPLRDRERWFMAHGFEANLQAEGSLDYESLRAEWVRALAESGEMTAQNVDRAWKDRQRPTFSPVFSLLLLMLLLVSPASAATHHVRQGGNDGAAGTATAPWASIAKANARAAPGDVVLIADGTYTDAPRPAVNGTPGKRITYIGNQAAPANVTITAGSPQVAGSYWTIKGMTFSNDLNITGTYDSVAYCILRGHRPQIRAADDCVLANCTIESQRFWFFGAESDTFPKAERDTIRDCTFILRPTSWGGHSLRFKAINDCVIERTRFDVDVAATAGDASVCKMFWVRRSKFVDVTWNLTNRCLTGCDESGWFCIRDHVAENLFLRCSITMNGPGLVQFFGSASGSYPRSVMNNNYEYCTIKAPGDGPYGTAMIYQDGARWDTLSHCTFVGKGAALQLNALQGPVLIDHCTFVGFSPWRGTFGIDTGPWLGTLHLSSNIFYTAASAPAEKEYSPLFTNRASVEGHLVSNNNLFFTKRGRDWSIYAYNIGLGNSAPGAGKPWNSAIGQDGASTFGSPLFADSSLAAFDARLRTGSAAIGRGAGGSDAGAIPFGPTEPPLENVPPAPLTDLALSADGRSVTVTLPRYALTTRRTPQGTYAPVGCGIDPTKRVATELVRIWGRPDGVSEYFRLLQEESALGKEGQRVTLLLPAISGAWTLQARVMSTLGRWDYCIKSIAVVIQ